MKVILSASLAVALTGSSLQAQEPPAAPADPRTRNGQATQDASVQQLLQQATQLVTEMQRQAGTDAGAHPSADQAAQSPLLQQFVRLALSEITQLQQQLKQDDGDGAGVGKDAAMVPSGEPGAPSPPSLSEAAYAVFAHAWDSSLSTGGLHTGGLQTGGLQTGSLQTGHLTKGHVANDPAANTTLPSRNFIVQTSVTPAAAVSTPPNSPPAVVSAPPVGSTPPADPDEEMLRWSRRIDQRYASEAAAQRAALRLYPALAVPHSAFNTQFLARYAQYRQADPFGFLRGPGWPMKLAIFTAGDLQRQRGGSTFSP